MQHLHTSSSDQQHTLRTHSTHILFFFLSTILFFPALSQVGIGTQEPITTLEIASKDTSGVLHPEDGILIPRVTSISVPGVEEGQWVYLSQDDVTNGYQKGFFYWNEMEWKSLGSSATSSVLQGDISLYTLGWQMGRINTSTATVSDLRGVAKSVTLEPALSSGQSLTYTVELSAEYLLGNIGQDFNILITNTTTNATIQRFRDSRIHHVFSKQNDSTFQVTLWSTEPSNGSNQTIDAGVSIGILRKSAVLTDAFSPSNLGIYDTLSSLETAYPSPSEGDYAKVSSLSPSLLHINSTTIPVGREEYSLYFNGSSWEVTGWASVDSLETDWIYDPHAFQVRSVSGPVEKATQSEFDLVRYKELGNHWIEVEMKYVADNLSGASNGSGDYLFSIPHGMQIDTNAHPVYTGSGVLSNSTASGHSLEMIQTIASQTSNSGSNLLAIPYNTSEFRMLAFDGSATNNYIRSSFYQIRFSRKVYYFRFRFKRL